jgi:hypothetical protein
MSNIMRTFCLALYAFLVHKIVLYFCVFPYQLTPRVAGSVSHDLLLDYVAQSYHGWNLLEVPAFCGGACDLTFVWGSALPGGRTWEQLVLMGGPNYTACWSSTLSVCALPF